MADDAVQLTDLEVIQQFSLAVRGATAPREEVIAALEADLAYLSSIARKGPAKVAPTAPPAAPARTAAPARVVAAAPKAPAKPAVKAPAVKAPAKKAPAAKKATSRR